MKDKIVGKIKALKNYKEWRKDTVRKAIMLVVLILFLCILVIYKCAQSDKVDENIGKTEIVDNEVKQVELYMYPLQSLNPLLTADENLQYINKLIYSSLFDFDENMAPVGDLADSYSFDGKNVEIKLKDAKWQDGQKVSAEDVDFTVRAIKQIGDKCPYYEKADKIRTVSGSGKNLTITFKEANDISLADLSFPIVAEHEYKSVYSFVNDDTDFEPFGSGMYKFDSYEPGDYLMLDVNDEYYGTKPISKVRVNIVKRDASLTKLLETSNISILYEKSLMRQAKITKKDIKINDIVSNQVEFVGINTKKQILADKKIRRALMQAIDQKTILEEGYYTSAIASDSLYFPNYLGAEEAKTYKYDLEKATKALKKLGFEDTNDDGILESEDGIKFSIKILVNKDNAQRVTVAENLQENLEKLNIDVTVDARSESEYLATLKTGNYDIYVGGMRMGESMDFRSLVQADGENNYVGYDNQELSESMDELMSGQKTADAKDLLVEIKKNLKEDAIYYCIGYQTYGIVEAPVFKGEIKSTFANPYKGIEAWYCVYEQRKTDDK